jgi:hypothetical protein
VQAVNASNDTTFQQLEVIILTTGRLVSNAHRRRPMIIPVVLEA